jgi:hypothetical protein
MGMIDRGAADGAKNAGAGPQLFQAVARRIYDTVFTTRPLDSSETHQY